MISEQLLSILCCPACHGTLVQASDGSALTCEGCHRTYAVEHDIPILLVDDAPVTPPAPPEPGNPHYGR